MAQALSEDELLALVDALADGQWQSGEALAARFGIGRAALAKRIAHLAQWQLEVEARQGVGYRLTQPLERLDAAGLQSALPGLAVRVLAATDSTSTRAALAPTQDDPQVWLAEYQHGGRGRRGRSWLSPFGAQLALSLAWSFDATPRQLAALPLAVGVACADALAAQGIADAGLKWPNDLYLREGDAPPAKLGGILLEHRGEAGGGCRVVVGIGINLRLSPHHAQAIAQPWTNLDAACAARGMPPVSRNRLAIDLLSALQARLEVYPAQGFEAVRARWEALDLTRGQALKVISGDVTYTAIGAGVDADGALQVRVGDELRSLYAGEVSLRMT